MSHKKVLLFFGLAIILLRPIPLTAQRDGPAGTLIRSLAWSPDGSLIAFGRQDGLVQIVDATTTEPVVTLLEDAPGPSTVGWSPDGTRLATGSADSLVRIWNVTDGQLLHTLTGHVGTVSSVAWSPDGSKLASGSTQGTENLRVWDVVTGSALMVRDASNTVRVDWSPDGTKLAVAEGGGLWPLIVRTDTGDMLLVDSDFHGEPGFPLTYVAWSPDGTLLAAASIDDSVRIWDMATGNLVQTLIGHADVVTELDWHPDGSKLLTTSLDDTVRVWDVSTGQTLDSLDLGVGVSGAAWNPEGTAFACGLEDGSIQVISFDSSIEISGR